MSYRLRDTTRLGDVATVLTNGSVVYGEGVPKFPTAVTSPIMPGQAVQTLVPQSGLVSGSATFSWTDPTTWPWYLWAGLAVGAYLLFVRE